MLSLFAKPKRSGKRKEPNMDPETRRVTGKKPVDHWSLRDYREAGAYLRGKGNPHGNGCLLWNGKLMGKVTKVGRAKFRKVTHPAHKLAFFQAHPEIPMQQGMTVKHTCGEKLCINPEHLQLETGTVFRHATLQEPLTERGEHALQTLGLKAPLKERAVVADEKTSTQEWLDVDLTPGVGNKSLAGLGVDLSLGQSKADDSFHSLDEWCAMGPAMVASSLKKKKKQRV